jgi:hypothetical protein
VSDEGNPRTAGALETLIELVQRVQSGDLYIGDFYVNKRASDPCRMNIEIKVVRGPGAAVAGLNDIATNAGYTSDPPVRYAEPDPRAGPINRSRTYRNVADAGRYILPWDPSRPGAPGPGPGDPYWIDENGQRVARVFVESKPTPKPPKPPKPQPKKLTNGARELDLDD